MQVVFTKQKNRAYSVVVTRSDSESNFDNVDEAKKHLIQKFLNRTLFYNQRMREELEGLGLIYIDGGFETIVFW